MRLTFICGALLLVAAAAAPAEDLIFPKPVRLTQNIASFLLDDTVTVALPPSATAADRALAKLLTAELTDRYQLALKTAATGGARSIVVGSAANPWIAQQLRAGKLAVPKGDGYVLSVSDNRILIAGGSDIGTFYGYQSLRQLLGPKGTRIGGMIVEDAPASPFRGIKMYLPGRANIGFFKTFVRDFMAQYKFNKLILELNAGMRLDRHPELNAGWIELGRDLRATRRERTGGPHNESQDSVHVDTADFGVLEKAEVADLANWARMYHIEVIPEIASLSHSYYLLARHRELAEIPAAEWPDTYCPSLPGSYALIFDVLDEYIEVLKPSMIHIGHDEWRIPWGSCKRCRDKDPRVLFAEDLNKIYGHLKAKNIKAAIWGDHLIEDLRGKRVLDRKTKEGYAYQTPGGLSAEQVRQLVPKDILIFNWFWDNTQPGQGEVNDRKLAEWGFQQLYGNMDPKIQEYARRSQAKGVIGGAPSSWAATTAVNFGKDLVDQFLGCAAMLWSREEMTPARLSAIVQQQLPRIQDSFRDETSWSRLSEKPVPVTLQQQVVANAPSVRKGSVKVGSTTFEVGALTYSGSEPASIPVNQDASSLVFLHASEKRGANTMSYRVPHDFDDTADLVGWYEVIYEDEFVLTIPLRSEVQILEWDLSKRKNGVVYAAFAKAVELSPSVTFHAYEWTNPRLGKVIREVRLHGVKDFRRADGSKASNGVFLAALSYVPARVARPAVKVTNIELE